MGGENAFITDLDRGLQIILVCHIKNTYRNIDFADQVSKEIHYYYSDWNELQMEKYAKSRVNFCMKEAFKIVEDYDSYFKRNLGSENVENLNNFWECNPKNLLKI